MKYMLNADTAGRPKDWVPSKKKTSHVEIVWFVVSITPTTCSFY